ncbi:DUF983 domain-containing protein [Sphingopyxis sp. YF1]|uniref:DUF983 domain-containing protein n=1 Tax=Sphingopyxis sp. YF1 TaxID=2482763 RepID=UPI001F621344|nr:DUF983 domain-containing protein [Sphingopyxis sp. YF1]
MPSSGDDTESDDHRGWRWIYSVGLRGLCPRCGSASMFRGWLKVEDECPACGLDYDFATPDDGPAFFALCFIAFPLLFLVVGFEVMLRPPWWVHLLVSLPLMTIPCVLALRPTKGWLVASQYVNRAQEAGTEASWSGLNARAKAKLRQDGPAGEAGQGASAADSKSPPPRRGD